MTNDMTNEHRPRAPKDEALTQREKPLVENYKHAVDVAVGALSNQFSHMPQHQRPVAKFGAPAVEQATNGPAYFYPKDIYNSVPSDNNFFPGAGTPYNIEETSEHA